MRAVILAGALAACTYPEKQFDRFACRPEPDSAVRLVTLSGRTLNPSDFMPVPGVTMALQNLTGTVIAGPVTSSDNGGFGFPLNTNATPVKDVYFTGEATGRIKTYFTPPRPITADLEVEFTMLSTMQRDELALGAIGQAFTAGTGAVLLEVKDCEGVPIENATVTSEPMGVVRYFEGIFPSTTRPSTDAGGVALVANLPVGTVSITATIDDDSFAPRTLLIDADAITRTVIQP
jgi:hypothetical protein